MDKRSKSWIRVPSPAMAVACLALAVALSGVGYAAVALPRNSVGTAQLKKNAVNSAKVKDRSLRGIDFALGQLPAGPQGPPGPPNPNADTLDGIDSADFMRGRGSVSHASLHLPNRGVFGQWVPLLEVPGFGRVVVNCVYQFEEHPGRTFLAFDNTSGVPLDMTWWNKDGVAYELSPIPTEFSPNPHRNTQAQAFLNAPIVVVLQISRPGGTATITSTARYTGGTTDCGDVSTQAVYQLG